MIGKLKGIVDSHGEDFVILDVNGVGYIVHCSGRTLQKLPRPGEASTLAIETQMRDRLDVLFYFFAHRIASPLSSLAQVLVRCL